MCVCVFVCLLGTVKLATLFALRHGVIYQSPSSEAFALVRMERLGLISKEPASQPPIVALPVSLVPSDATVF